MRRSDSRRVLFVHIPKTGGSTVDHIFDREVADARGGRAGQRHATYQELVRTEPHLERYWSFGFVRNPWARMVSWWAFGGAVVARAARGMEGAVAHFRTNPERWAPFEAYCGDFRRFVLEGTEAVERFGQPQVRWLTKPDGGLVDFVGRVETFEDDLNVLREHLGLQPVVTHRRKNRSPHGHYQDYYDDETRTRVAEVFADDVEAFGYTF